ncbi:hypothetical protein SAMN02990966_07285 [Rhodospirillales bacterium URHD0017]|nr:hypothetical protein SAMN02990966_07285 [Rhodospirillales bacterium URHD0017]
MAPWLATVVKEGFALGIVDIRGTGASFGTWNGPFSLQEAEDAYDVIETLARKPWCNGAVGLVGRSYMGANQFVAALLKPPSLIGIFAEMAPFDVFHLVHQNGIFREDFAESWAADITIRDCTARGLAVEGDHDGSLLAAARAEHRGNPDIFIKFKEARFRDSVDVETGTRLYEAFNPAHHLTHGPPHDIPTYILSGWHDINSADALHFQFACKGPVKTVIGPWAHAGSFGIDLADECVSWYRHLMATPPAERRLPHRETTYCQMSGGGQAQWFQAKRADLLLSGSKSLYPCEGQRDKPFGLSEVEDERHGLLGPCAADPETTSGISTRWTNGYGGPFGYGDLRGLAAQGMALSSPPLQRPLELVGTPVLALDLAETTTPSLFFFLADIHPDGFAQYVTEGALALAHRKLTSPIYETGGRPFHRGNAEDMLADRYVTDRIKVALLPVAWEFVAGHRIELIVVAADKDNAENTTLKGQQFAFLFGPGRSRLDLPIDTPPGVYFAADAGA